MVEIVGQYTHDDEAQRLDVGVAGVIASAGRAVGVSVVAVATWRPGGSWCHPASRTHHDHRRHPGHQPRPHAPRPRHPSSDPTSSPGAIEAAERQRLLNYAPLHALLTGNPRHPGAHNLRTALAT
ncbi:MAG: hypothetical protein ACR2HD_00365 [Solirubrobacteraceae bacterium]